MSEDYMGIEDLRYELEHFLNVDCSDVADGFIILMHQMQLEYNATKNPAMRAMAEYVFELVHDGVKDTQAVIKSLRKQAKQNKEFAGALDEKWDSTDSADVMNQYSKFDD